MPTDPLIPRQPQQEKLLANIAKRQPTLLTGDVGIGKTVLLKQIASEQPKAIYLESPTPFKSALLELLKKLNENGDLRLEGITNIEYIPWEEIKKKLNRYTIKELVQLCQHNLNGKGYTLFFDSLETASPAMARQVQALMDYALVIGAANHRNFSLRKLWWRFELLEIPPLTPEESKQLLWTLLDKDAPFDAELFERNVLNQANGNPLAITHLAEKIQKETPISKEHIRELRHEAGTKFMDITPLFFFVGACAIAVRFIALGLNSTDLYILAGVCGGLFLGLRSFLYRTNTKGGHR